ncbi:MAG: gamma-glutamylcyclotransferase family protein [bacterium]
MARRAPTSPLLFSYGSLQLESVQLSTFRRRLAGWPDELVGFSLSKVEIRNPVVAAALGKTHHDNVVFSGDSNCRVSGMVFEIDDEELASVDAYEVADEYARTEASLASGLKAWVYVHAPGREGPRS